jgi:hypothetical protein
MWWLAGKGGKDGGEQNTLAPLLYTVYIYKRLIRKWEEQMRH